MTVREVLHGVQQPEAQQDWAEYIVEIFGHMTLRQLQAVVLGTRGGSESGCDASHECHQDPVMSADAVNTCTMHTSSNRCNHQCHIASTDRTAGGAYLASVMVWEALGEPGIFDAQGVPVTRLRILNATEKLADTDVPARHGYRRVLGINLHSGTEGQTDAMLRARTPGEMVMAVKEAKEPYGLDMDLTRAALIDAFTAKLGQLPAAEEQSPDPRSLPVLA